MGSIPVQTKSKHWILLLLRSWVQYLIIPNQSIGFCCFLDRGFSTWSYQIKAKSIEIGVCCFLHHGFNPDQPKLKAIKISFFCFSTFTIWEWKRLVDTKYVSDWREIIYTGGFCFSESAFCSFCWYWWNCWPSLFKLSFHKTLKFKCVCVFLAVMVV